MKRVLKLIKRKNALRRLLATAFVVLMFADIGSHAILDREDGSGFGTSAWCKVLHHLSPSADCPHKRHQGFPQANLSNDVVHHWILLEDMTVPVAGIVYESEPLLSAVAFPI